MPLRGLPISFQNGHSSRDVIGHSDPAARAAGEEDDKDEVYRETSARLLELAGFDQEAFRGVVGGMNESQKGFMEGVIRSGRRVVERRETDGERPTIALKMDFGN